MWGTFLSEPLRIVALVGRCPANKLMRRMPIPDRRIFHPAAMQLRGLRGIRPSFPGLSPCPGQVAYVLLTSAPVADGGIATASLPLDLHVLSLSLAFILSQDQTLRCVLSRLLFFTEDKSGTLPTQRPLISRSADRLIGSAAAPRPEGRARPVTCHSRNLDRRSAESLPCLSPACQISSSQTSQ